MTVYTFCRNSKMSGDKERNKKIDKTFDAAEEIGKVICQAIKALLNQSNVENKAVNTTKK